MPNPICRFLLLSLLLIIVLGSCNKPPQATATETIDQQDEVISPAKEKLPQRLEPFVHSYGEGVADNLAKAKLQAFDQAKDNLLIEVLAVADQVARKEGKSIGLEDTDAFLLRFHDIVARALKERQVDMETVREAVQRLPDADYRYMLELRLSKAFIMQEVQRSVREVENALPVSEERFLSAFAQALRSKKTIQSSKSTDTKKDRRNGLSK